MELIEAIGLNGTTMSTVGNVNNIIDQIAEHAWKFERDIAEQLINEQPEWMHEHLWAVYKSEVGRKER